MPDRPYTTKTPGRATMDRLDPLPRLYRSALASGDFARTRNASRVLVNSKFVQDQANAIYAINAPRELSRRGHRLGAARWTHAGTLRPVGRLAHAAQGVRLSDPRPRAHARRKSPSADHRQQFPEPTGAGFPRRARARTGRGPHPGRQRQRRRTGRLLSAGAGGRLRPRPRAVRVGGPGSDGVRNAHRRRRGRRHPGDGHPRAHRAVDRTRRRRICRGVTTRL